MGNGWKFGQWQKVANNLKDTSAFISFDSLLMLIQDLRLHLAFSVTTVNVAGTTDKCLFCLACLFGLLCCCFCWFLLLFLLILWPLYIHMCVPWILPSCDYKDFMVLNIALPFYDYNFIICFVLSYLVKLRFPFIRPSSCSGLLHLTHFMILLPSCIYLPISSLPSLASYSVYSASCQL